mmetsp:Transcript_10524/g.20207  ORF Transcript_10524/g.20207 Transcript_10524/m.20207 type:complete len:358 (-) Transcript_10524:206-1279(-)
MPQPSKEVVKSNAVKSNGKSSGFMNTMIAGVLLIMYFGMNLVFNIYNKWLFSGPLPAPVFVTATHQAFCFLGAAMAAMLAPESWYKRTPLEGSAMWSKLMIIPFGFCLNIGLNNISLLFCTLALNQLIRSFSPVAVAIASYFIEGRTYSYPKQATLALLVLGICLGVSSSPDFEMLGFLICAASVVGSTLQVVLTGYFMGGQKVTLHVFDILLYTAIPCILFLVPLAYATGDFPKTLAAIEDHGVGRFTGLVCAGGAMAFSYNIITILLIKYTSSVYYAVAGGFKVCIVIGSSFIFFDQQLSMLSLVGIIISCFAFVGNSYLTFKEKQQAKEKAKAKQISEDREGLITGKPKSVEAV